MLCRVPQFNLSDTIVCTVSTPPSVGSSRIHSLADGGSRNVARPLTNGFGIRTRSAGDLTSNRGGLLETLTANPGPGGQLLSEFRPDAVSRL